MEQCIARTGMTPTAYLDSLGMFEYGGGGFHCVHMTEEDLRIFQKRGLSVVTNPGSNTKLASGIAPIRRMMELGINIGIGTDGPASNNCLDMFREMFLTTGLAKLREKDAAVVDAGQVLYMATAGGAKACGLNECDALAEGKLADLIMIDLHQPNMQPLNNIAKNLVYSGSKQNVKLTMVNGRILYENGEFFVGEIRNIFMKSKSDHPALQRGGIEMETVVKIRSNLADKIMQGLGLALMVGVSLYLIIGWSSFPDKVPMHYGAAERSTAGEEKERYFPGSAMVDHVSCNQRSGKVSSDLEYGREGDGRKSGQGLPYAEIHGGFTQADRNRGLCVYDCKHHPLPAAGRMVHPGIPGAGLRGYGLLDHTAGAVPVMCERGRTLFAKVYVPFRISPCPL